MALEHLVRSTQARLLDSPLPNETAASTLTLSADAITPTSASHALAAETGTADNLVTVTTTHFREGDTIKVWARSGDTITVKASGGNITTADGVDIVLDSPAKFCFLHITASGVVASLGGGASPSRLFEFTGDGATAAFDIARPLTTEDTAIVHYDGLPVAKSEYSIAAATPANGQTRFTLTFVPANGVPITIFA